MNLLSFIKRCGLCIVCTLVVFTCIAPFSANSYAVRQTPDAAPDLAVTEAEGTISDEGLKPSQSVEPTVRSAQAGWPVSVWHNGQEMPLAVKTLLKDGTTFVSITDFCRVMNCERVWENGGFTATRGDELYIRCEPGNFYLIANDRVLNMGKSCFITAGELMIPIRTMATIFDMSLQWNGRERRVYLEGSGLLKSGDDFYNEKDLYWLSRIINAEARGESLIGQLAVGSVVLNRVKSKEYPNTIYGVIFDRKNGVQFTPIKDGSIYLKPYDICVLAAKLCLEGVVDYSNGAIYFISEKVTSCYAMSHCEKVATIGGHRFYGEEIK